MVSAMGHLIAAIGSRALGVEDDPAPIVDEIVGIVGKQRVHALACDPGRLRIGQRDLLGWLVAAIARAAAITISGPSASQAIPPMAQQSS